MAGVERLAGAAPRMATPCPAGDGPEPPPRLPVERPRRGCWVAIALLVATGCGATQPTAPPTAPSPALGRAVAISLPSRDGTLVTLPLPETRATVVDVFAPTCEPCREKLPALYARRGELEQAGGRLVLVAVLADGESTEDAAAALRSWGVEAPFLVDRGEALRRECAVDTLPATVVLDARGVVRWVAAPTAAAGEVVAAARAVAGGR